ncbi:MAG: sulfatase-like hydrolase/transferase [Lachnospiraceae bacterium]
MKNILILHTDQLRYDCLGCNGNPNAVTPNIDKLAEEGFNFHRHMTSNPVCMPSRACLLTGLYPSGNGVTSNGINLWTRDNGCEDKGSAFCKNLFGVDVLNKVPTIAHMLKEEGYQTSLFGKLHLQSSLADPSYNMYESRVFWEKEEAIECTQEHYGFEYCRMALGHGEAPTSYNAAHYGRWMHKNHPEIIEALKQDEATRYGEEYKYKRGDIYPSIIPSKLHNSNWLANEFISYITNEIEADKPFFTFLGFPDPHHSFTPPKDILDEYLAIKTPVLPEFGERSKIVGETPVVTYSLDYITAEQGDIETAYIYTQALMYQVDKAVGKIVDELKRKGIYDDTIIVFTSDHGDLLGDYGCLTKMDIPLEGLVHIPFMVKPAKGFDKDVDTNIPMSNADVVPTLLHMIGVEPSKLIQGVDIFDEESKNNTPMTTCYSIMGKNRNITLYDLNYRYTYYIDDKVEELYSVTDKFQYDNLALKAEYREICDNMQLALFKKHIESEIGVFNHHGLW